MNKLAIAALVALSGCGLITEYPCGLDCTSEPCVCNPHEGSTDRFWVRTAPYNTVEFRRCDCTVSRRVQSDGTPVPSDPGLSECWARITGIAGDCEMSRDQNNGYGPCVVIVEVGGSVACGSPP
jgi:hypothetical protein